MTLHFTHWCSGDNQSVRSSAPVVSRWLGPGNRTFLEVVSMVVTWWIVAFFVQCVPTGNVIYLQLTKSLQLMFIYCHVPMPIIANAF